MTFDSYAKASSHGDAVYLSTCMSQKDKRDSRVGRSTENLHSPETHNFTIYVCKIDISIHLFIRFPATNTFSQ